MENLTAIPTIAITVEEYKDLLRAQTELAIIYQKSAPGGQQPSYSQGDPDDFSVIDDSDDLPF